MAYFLTSLYVGNKAPFDLLLGRPWQRGNYISIDERLDGTYLQFKDKGLRVNYEILVTPDKEVDPEIAEYVARTAASVQAFHNPQIQDLYTTTGNSTYRQRPQTLCAAAYQCHKFPLNLRLFHDIFIILSRSMHRRLDNLNQVT